MILAQNLLPPSNGSENKMMLEIRKIVLIFALFCSWSGFSQEQKYRGHLVEEGETAISIAKAYGTTPLSIESLNPDVNINNLKIGDLLVIPPSIDIERDRDLLGSSENADEETFTHKVKSLETLYKISREYNTTPQAIQKINPNINVRRLLVGQIIRIPYVDYERDSKKNAININDKLTKKDLERYDIDLSDNLEGEIYIVKPGDTPYSVARDHRIKFRKLMRFNQKLGRRFQVGDIVFLSSGIEGHLRKRISNYKPKIQHHEKPYILYDIHSRDTLYNISKKFNVTEEQIYEINSTLKETGLKAGFTIKIPLSQESVVYKVFSEKIELALNPTIRSKDTINAILVLPLRLDKQKTKLSRQYSFRKIFQDKLLAYSLDFYKGVLVALDSLKRNGAHINLEVLDDNKSSSGILRLMSLRKFDDADVVIGPFYAEQFNLLSEYLEREGIPIISPFFNEGITKRFNTVISVPSKDLLRERIMNYVKKEDPYAKIFLVTEVENRSNKEFLCSAFPNLQYLPMEENQISIKVDTLKYFFSFVWKPKPKDSIQKSPKGLRKEILESQEDGMDSVYRNVLDYEGRGNIVFIETKSPMMLTGVTSVLNTFVSDTCNLRLFTTERNSAYDEGNVLNTHLSNLKFTYPSVNKPLTDFDLPHTAKFMDIDGIYPSRYTSRGFDLTMDIISRMYRGGKDWFLDLDSYKTKQMGSIFDYEKSSEGGFYNTGAFIMTYKDMYLKEEEE